ncbi:MAG: class I SAM-dependent methyltransferase [Pseudonocardiaceae bacterium]
MLVNSPWGPARTFFPIFEALVRTERSASVLVIGASDGKFVLPLAERGIQVVALDVDKNSLLSGQGSLKWRADNCGLSSSIACVHGDMLEVDLGEFDAVWTSCSWHYSRNFGRPLADYIDAMKRHIRRSGIFAAEYMMPVDVKHVQVEHYIEPGEVWGFLRSWERLWDAYTTAYEEAPHPGQDFPHVHRMGFCVARKPS